VEGVAGKVDMLLGFDIHGIFPLEKERKGQLALWSSRLGTGWMIAGRADPECQCNKCECTVAISNNLTASCFQPLDFIRAEAMGTDTPARCPTCRSCRECQFRADSISFKENKPELIYSEETKKVSGFVCKKVTIKTLGQNGQVSENIIWYNPDFKISPKSTAASANPGGFGGGRSGGMSMMGGTIPGLDLINGFPMEYEMVRGNGFKMHMTVLKIQPDAQIDDKTFEVPKGFDIKPMGQGGDMMRTIFRNGSRSEN
jgi:hypothetical protein